MEESRLKVIRANEIDLFDLTRILVRYKILIMIVTVIVSILSLGLALHTRNIKKDAIAQNFIVRNKLDSFFIKKANLKLRTFRIEDSFKDDKIVDKMFVSEDLLNIFKDTGAEENIENKRMFLENNIRLEKVIDENKKFLNYKISFDIEKSYDTSIRIIERYLNLINENKVEIIKEAINDKYSDVEKKDKTFEEQLKKINSKVKNLIEKEPMEVLSNQEFIDILNNKYPILLEKQNKLKELYSKYSNELTGLNGLINGKEIENQIEKQGSIYLIKGESKAKLILITGIILGFILGVMSAFVMEFIERYKNLEK